MSIRKISFSTDEYYHIYNRGNAKRIIFKDQSDYRRFTQLLFVCNSTKSMNFRDIPKDFEQGHLIVAIGAYCLMPNHFHLLIKEIEQGGITKFMQKVSTSYAMYFNKKYDMSGSLFEGKFKAQHANNDRYLRYLYSYIHLNPIKLIEPLWKEKGLKNTSKCFDFLDRYEYSSYGFYIESQNKKSNKFLLLSSNHFPTYFLSALQHKKDLLSWLRINP